MTHVSGAACVVRALEECGVSHIFGVPGTHNLEIYRELGGSTISHVLPRHEQGAGYAADGFARVSRSPGVVLTTSGPGLLNAAAAAATSYAEFVPVLYLSPGPHADDVGRDAGLLHEMKDQSGVFERLVDRSVRVASASEAYAAVHETFARWRREPPRPVHLEIPQHVLGNLEHVGELAPPEFVACPHPARDRVRAAARLLQEAGRVVIIVGRGAAAAGEATTALAEALDAVVVSTVNGKGVVREDHPLAVGAVIRFEAAHRVIESADAVLVVGSRLGSAETWSEALKPRGRVVRVDIGVHSLKINVQPHVGLHGDATAVLEDLLEELPSRHPVSKGGSARAAELRDVCRADGEARAAPYSGYLAALGTVLPRDTIVVGDSAQVSYLAAAHLWPALRPGTFLYPAIFATLGYGIPAAVGAALAVPGRAVVALVGDGGTMFSIQEFATAVQLGLSLPILVFDNGGFREIREGMEQGGIAPLAVDIPCPDLATLGRAMGGFGATVRRPLELAAEVERALRRSGPTLIRVEL